MISLESAARTFSTVIGHSKTFLKTNAPTIMIVGGIAFGITAAVLACKATENRKDILEDTENALEELHDQVAHSEISEEEWEKECSKVQIKGYVKIAKNYIYAITAGIIAIALILGSHSIMQKRCAALVTAYNALSTTMTTFYEHVKEELGEEKADELLHRKPSLNGDEVYNSIVEADERCNLATGAGYWTYFDEASKEYRGDYAHDYTFLKSVEMYANDRLKAEGVVTMNSIYKDLGLKETNEGLVVGWSLRNGDKYIDFGLSKPVNKPWHDSQGRNGKCVLSFNVNGVIYGSL